MAVIENDVMDFSFGDDEDEELFIAPLLQQHSKAAKAIKAIDEKLAYESAGKTKVLNEAVNGVAENQDLQNFITNARNLIDQFHGAERIGIIVTLRRLLREEDYEKEVNDYVNANVVKVEKPSDEEIAELREKRKKAVNVAESIKNLIGQTHPERAAQLPEFKNLRGAVGKTGARGPRLKKDYNFVVDGDIVGTTLGDVKDAVKADSVKTLRGKIEEQNPNFDWDNSPSRFEFSFNDSDGKVHKIVASEKSNNESPSDPGDDDDDTDNSDDEILNSGDNIFDDDI